MEPWRSNSQVRQPLNLWRTSRLQQRRAILFSSSATSSTGWSTRVGSSDRGKAWLLAVWMSQRGEAQVKRRHDLWRIVEALKTRKKGDVFRRRSLYPRRHRIGSSHEFWATEQDSQLPSINPLGPKLRRSFVETSRGTVGKTISTLSPSTAK